MGNMQSNPSSSSSSPPPTTPSASASACPVDPAARQAYLEAAAASSASNPSPSTKDPNSITTPRPSTFPTLFSSNPSSHQQREDTTQQKLHPPPLGSTRITSTIPRAPTSPSTTTPSPTSSLSPNNQTPHPSTSASGNWIYPSEKMFFDALKRKNHSPSPNDMATVVPIHNAVNERAWKLIKEWELRFARKENEGCGGPRLRSFSGDSGKVSLRARWLGVLGFERPFDRHDWVVERCPTTRTVVAEGGVVGGGKGGEDERGGEEGDGKGVEVEYVIDFYRGRESEKGGGVPGGLNFYLDVRPKLNSWEGWRMRIWRFWGL